MAAAASLSLSYFSGLALSSADKPSRRRTGCASVSPPNSPSSKRTQHQLSLSFTSPRRPSYAARASTIKVVAMAANKEPLKVMISGAPASGKGTQCELIKSKFGLVHISAGDLLRAEIATGSENGTKAKEFMEKGMLVPDEIVVAMVKSRLMQPDVEQNGWLLDGYPRSLSQAMALENLNIRPDIFILLEVSDELLVERVVGRRSDPVTGKIYHLKYSPPENDEIASRLTQRFDDTEEKVKLRLQTYYQNVESVVSVYDSVMYKVNGDVSKEEVFTEIDKGLLSVLENKSTSVTA